MEEKNLNVLILSDSFYPVVGGRERAIDNLMLNLNNKCNCTLATLDIKINGKSDKTRQYRVVKCKCIKVLKDCYLGVLNPKFKREIENEFKMGKVDIIHTETKFKLANYGIKLAKKYNVPIVTSCHTDYDKIYKQTAPLVWKIVLNHTIKTINKMDYCFAVSDFLESKLKKLGVNVPIKVIPNGVDGTELSLSQLTSLANKTYKLENEKNILICVARLSKTKNIDFLIKSLALVKSDYKMIFIGGGEITKYKNICKKYGILNKCLFTGAIYDKDILYSLFARATLNLQPSVIESYGMTIDETSFTSSPSLVVNGYATSSRITDNVNGFVCEEDPKLFAKKIDELLKDKETLIRVGKTAKETLNQPWEKISELYLTEYKKICNK